jgi:hypothetical protein
MALYTGRQSLRFHEPGSGDQARDHGASMVM